MIEETRFFLGICVHGLPLGSIYCLLALSFVLIFKATKILNLCQGEIMMLGAYVTYSAVHLRVPYFAAILISFVVVSFVAILLEKIILRKVMGKPVFVSIMITVGLGIMLRGLIGVLWGVDQKVFNIPYFETMANLPALHLNYGKLFIIFTAILLIIVLEIFFKLTRLGMAMKATASNLIASMFMGVNAGNIFSLAWLLAAVVSVFTGVFLARLTILEPGISQYALVALSALVLGGVDSILGTILGGYVIGIAESIAAFYIGGQSKNLVGFAIMFLVLMIRPYGLFGIKKIERV